MPDKKKKPVSKEIKDIADIKKEIADIWDTLEETLIHLNWMSEKMTTVLTRMGIDKNEK
tara:strand:+ start:212 stop:388 length:177 start_codon:yes stop_codon:yes gene_type:complete